MATGSHQLVGLARERVRASERHQPPKLPERLGIVLDAQRDDGLPRLGVGRDDQDRRRLAAAKIAALALGRVERIE